MCVCLRPCVSASSAERISSHHVSSSCHLCCAVLCTSAVMPRASIYPPGVCFSCQHNDRALSEHPQDMPVSSNRSSFLQKTNKKKTQSCSELSIFQLVTEDESGRKMPCLLCLAQSPCHALECYIPDHKTLCTQVKQPVQASLGVSSYLPMLVLTSK